jgi:hypothetical protein
VTAAREVTPQKVSRGAGLAAAAASSPWMPLMSHFGDPKRGLLASASSIIILCIAVSYWNYRHRAWFWLCLAVFSIAHALLTIALGDMEFQYAALLIPVFLLDFVTLSFAMGLVGDRFEYYGDASENPEL